jgi:hypothetical protein
MTMLAHDLAELGDLSGIVGRQVKWGYM